MRILMRSVLLTGLTTLAISAVTITSSVQPFPTRRSTVTFELAASVQPAEPGPHLLQVLLSDPIRLLGPAVPVGTITPPPTPAELALAPNLADSVDNIYLWGEPWVRYGFQVATDLLGWVPWVGWLSGQIMVFYNFFEGMVASGTFNVTDWLRGNGGAVSNFIDWGIDVGLAWAWLGIDEWNYFLPPLPPSFPRPPRPPFEGRPGPNFLAQLGLPGSPDISIQGAEVELADTSEPGIAPKTFEKPRFDPSLVDGQGRQGVFVLDQAQRGRLNKDVDTVETARNEIRPREDGSESRTVTGVVQAQGHSRVPVARTGNETPANVRGKTGTTTTGTVAKVSSTGGGSSTRGQDSRVTVKQPRDNGRQAADGAGNAANNHRPSEHNNANRN